MNLKCIDSNGMEIREKNCKIKSYLFNFDGKNAGTLKLVDEKHQSAIYRINSCFSDSSCTVFKGLDDTTFVVSDY